MRSYWSSRLAFVWVSAGAAVGLGNIWKFPYMVGSHGGSAFVLLYLFFVALIGIPIMIAEIFLGAHSQCNPIGAFEFLSAKYKQNSNWSLVGYMSVISLLLIFCFYSVVSGWSVAYVFFGLTNQLANLDLEHAAPFWQDFLANTPAQVACSLLFIGITMGIVWFGVKSGIERACGVIMPALLIVLVLLVVYASMVGDFAKTLSFLFSFEPAKINSGVVIASLGHALFTLAIGACCMMVYGSYLKPKISIIKSVFIIALLDVLVALLSGFAIFPLLFKQGLAPSQGSGLMFVSLPSVFALLPMSAFWGTLFFVLLFFAALSSSLSFAEPLVNICIERLGFSRHRSVIIITFITSVGAVLCACSSRIFLWATNISTNLLLPMGALGISLFAGKILLREHMKEFDGFFGLILFKTTKIILLFIAPVIIGLILLSNILGPV